MRYRLLDTPLGPFVILRHDDRRLTTTFVSGESDRLLRGGQRDDTMEPELHDRFARYFAGEPADFSIVPTPDGPPFYRRCWDAARSIPHGQTRTYGQLAVMAGSSPGAARSAGQAMRHNPLGIIIPCHRVLASGGRLGGFGGRTEPDSPALSLKRRLLTHEKRCQEPFPAQNGS